ncbi:glycosyltransferase [Actinophytocola sp.]|uniref:glycosyltransferase n=1 Tax=Actinophytocola sp. TaxID=1872138 RepID=UPI002D7F5080|nr:glycosyltransferase [Actinophytocola sp.]HET9138252.1 glycosyltransferase [Actinophytocola sp.]
MIQETQYTEAQLRMATEHYHDAPAAEGAQVPRADIWRVVQRVMFASPSPKAPDQLYRKGLWGAVRCERHRAVIEPDARLSTNTYFGRLPAGYLQRWTGVRDLEAVFRVRGAGRLEIHASDAEGQPRILSTLEVRAETEQEVRLPAVLDRFMDGGLIWVEAVTAGEELTIEDCRWVAAAPPRTRPTSVVICTYNRADDCLATMRALGEDSEVLRLVDHVYVVDQGTDTVRSREDFDKVAALYEGKLHYLQQPNLGGAGGFSRGMYEVTGQETGKQANILLMDDDVLLEPETVLRMTAFANQASEPTIVGGQMLYLYHPNRLHVSAETADLPRLRPGVPTDGAQNNIDLTKKLPHKRVNAGYNAWWSCLIPAEVVDRIGLPLPMFFQWDDIEYGIRAGGHGFATVTLPGAAVWHADFTWKDWDDWARYFSLRNSLITSALHSDFDGKQASVVLAKQLTNYLVSMQYGMAATLLKALEDFLSGPDVLADGGVSAAAEIRALRNDYPDTHRRTPEDIGVDRARTMPIVRDAGTPSLMMATLAKRLVYLILGRNLGEVAVSAKDANWWHVSRFNTVVVTDSAQDAFRVRQFDKAVLIRLAREGAQLFKRLTKEGATVREEWRAAMPRLTTRENWERLYHS